MAYSSGFSPHPRISYANAAPTGTASEAEYLEIALAQEQDPDTVRRALDRSLPQGLDIVEVVLAQAGPSLADRLTGSLWKISLVGVDEDVLADTVTQFLAADTVLVTRMMKSGLREFDVRGPVVQCEVSGHELEVLIAHDTPLVRPDDFVKALVMLQPSLDSELDIRSTRLEQGTLVDGSLANPLA